MISKLTLMSNEELEKWIELDRELSILEVYRLHRANVFNELVSASL